MRRTLARELPAAEPGSTVTVQGWVHRRRTLATVTFVVVRDRSGLAQVVVKDPVTIEAVTAYDEPIEDKPTFEGNALLKARAGLAATGLPSVADDSGLAVVADAVALAIIDRQRDHPQPLLARQRGADHRIEPAREKHHGSF